MTTTNSLGFWFHERLPSRGIPGGYTVSKRKKLPSGHFQITEYEWPLATLWFVDADNFTAGERQQAYVAHCCERGLV